MAIQLADMRGRAALFEGQGLVEYSLILVVVSISALAALGAFASGAANLLNVSL